MDPIKNDSTLAGEYFDELQKVTKAAERSLERAKKAIKDRWDKNKKREEPYKEGDLVLVQSDYLPSRRPLRKLDDKWRGPLRIIGQRGPAASKIDLPPTWKGHKVFNSS
jgi:hypothetical protein